MLRAKFKMVNEVQDSIVETQYILSISTKNDYDINIYTLFFYIILKYLFNLGDGINTLA